MRPFPFAPFAAAVLLFTATGAAAQGGHTEFRYGADLFTSGIDPVAADSAHVGSRTYGFQVTGNLVAFRVLSLNADGGMLLMSDEAPFTQETNRGEQRSSVDAGMASLSAGVLTPPVSTGGAKPLALSAGVNAGSTWLTVARGITDCADCHSEKVNVRAGGFWEPVVLIGMGRGALSARYRTYVGGSDFRNALMIGYTTGPRPRKAQPTPAAAPSP
jgi:hypothetical protein